MEVPWIHKKCILCRTTDCPLTNEHIIPEVIGGKLVAKFICKHCNSKLGTECDAAAKADPVIRMAADRLSKVLPDLSRSMLEGQKFLGKTPIGEVPGTIKRNEFRVQGIQDGKGSIFLPTPEGLRTIKRILTKQGRSEEEIKESVEKIKRAPKNTKTSFAEDLDVIEWEVVGIRSNYEDGKAVSDRWLLKIAFEFLACYLDASIYQTAFDPLRKCICGTEDPTEHCWVDRFQTKEYRPIHGLVIEENVSHGRVQIRLFGKLAYRVNFRKLRFGGRRLVYTLNLETGDEAVDFPESSGS